MAEQFGRYELLRRVGAGGMAEVFKAKTFGPEGFVKDVVIKRILPAFSEDPDFVRMFINEARLAARLQHANVVQIFDFNQVDGVYYIAMEWVDGTDLRRITNRSRRRAMPVPIRAAIHVGVETLKGLHYASTRRDGGKPLKLVHRDISPHNLLVSFSGEVKITDFGIAKVAALASSTRTGMLKGKLGYMSPEQASGEVLDARSDLFSLGIVVWELVTGRRLYQGDSEAELFAQVKRAQVPPPSSIQQDIPRELEQLLMRMLDVRRDGRFADAADALEEFGRIAAVGDGLVLSAYLRRLMPDALTRDGHRETKQLHPQTPPQQGAIFAASPDAPTHTRSPDGEEGGEATPMDGGSPASVEAAPERTDLAAGDLRLSRMETISRSPGNRRRLARLMLLTGIALPCVVGGWLIAGGFSWHGGETASSERLLVESDPPGAELWVEGIRMGRTPKELNGAVGASLDLELRFGDRTARKNVPVAHRRVRFDLSAEATPDASPPDQQVRVQRADGSAPHRLVVPAKRGSIPDGARSVAPHRPAVRKAGYGLLDVLVSPWAVVRVDGQELGNTPQRGIRLTVGRHRVDLFNPELDRRLTETVEIKANRRVTLRKNWD